MFLPAFICLFVCLFACLSVCFVCVQHNSKSYGSILMKFSDVGNVTKKRLLNFGYDPEQILDSGSL